MSKTVYAVVKNSNLLLQLRHRYYTIPISYISILTARNRQQMMRIFVIHAVKLLCIKDQILFMNY
ncbi:hypothetical protein A0256_15030 [Mucilaginibacter sp. PAMC 26640]|nr:hypothetical protein A0256_15030 [Mucilaginibacter sp. PAMC 26640]